MAVMPTAQSRNVLIRALTALVLVLVLLLSGCTLELALDTTVRTDGSGTIGIRMAADKEIQDLLAQQGGGDLFAEFENQMPEGWEVDSGTDPDGTRWVMAQTSFADLDEFQALLQEGSGGPAEAFAGQQVSLTQEGGLFTTKTVFQAEWDAGSALSSAGSELPEGVDMSMLSSIFQVQNRLTLPGSVGENNADEVDGNTLVWTPGTTGVTTLSAESTAYNWAVIIGIIVAVVAVLAVIVVVLLVVVLRRKAPAAPPEGAAGVPPAAGPSESGGPGQPLAQQAPFVGQPPAGATGQAGETLWAGQPGPPEVVAPPLTTPPVYAPPPAPSIEPVVEAPAPPVVPPVEPPPAPPVEPPLAPPALPAEPAVEAPAPPERVTDIGAVDAPVDESAAAAPAEAESGDDAEPVGG